MGLLTHEIGSVSLYDRPGPGGPWHPVWSLTIAGPCVAFGLVRRLPQACVFGVVLVLVAYVSATFGAAPPREVEAEPFRAIRTRDQLILSVGPGSMTFNETIVLSPLTKREDLQPGRPNLLHILIPPLWLKEGESERPAFGTLRPYYSSSHGRVHRFALMRPDGEKVLNSELITPDCRYVLTLEFGHVIPARFTVNVGFSSSRGITPETQFFYTPSNDGYPVVSGPSETVLTDLHLNTDASLQPWKVVQGDKVLPRATDYLVRLDRELNHVIRFAQE